MSFLTNFKRDRQILENDGVYIGGWSMRNLIKPVMKDNKHGMSPMIPLARLPMLLETDPGESHYRQQRGPRA